MGWPDYETSEAVKFWGLVFLGLAGSVLAGREIVAFSSPWLTAVVAGTIVAFLTFYSPKLALGLLVFAMLLSPKVQGAQIAAASRHGAVLVRFDDVLLVIIFAAWLGRTAVVKGSGFLARTPVNMPIFLYTVVYVLSTIFSIMRGEINPLRSFFYILKYAEYFFLFFMTVNIVENDEDMRPYLWCGWLTAIAVTIYGYWQIPGGGRVTAPFEDPIGAQRGPGEANTLGGYYVVVFSVLLAVYTQGSIRASALALASLLFMLAPFAMTLSRASYAALFGSVGCLLYLTPRRRLSLALALGMAAVTVLFVPKIRNKVAERVEFTFDAGGVPSALSEISLGPLGSIHLEPSAMGRIRSWQYILFDKFPRHPIFGSGVTAVGLVDSQIPLILGEAGLLGLTLFAWMISRVWRVAGGLWAMAQNDLHRALALSLMVALVGLLIQSLGANTFIIVRIMEPFWFLAALASRAYVNLHASGAESYD